MQAIKLLCGDDPRTCEMWGAMGQCAECVFAEKADNKAITLANLTMHDQGQFADRFRELGYKINPKPLLREVHGTEDAKAAACEALRAAKAQGAQGILLGGRTDVCVYAAILAVAGGLQVFIAETERVRDEKDRFVFALKGVTPIDLACMVDEVWLQWGARVQGVDRPTDVFLARDDCD